MNKSLTLPIVILVLLVIAFAAVWMKGEREIAVSAVTNYEECAAAGHPIQESFPERCTTPDGRTFTRNVEAPVEPVAEAPVRNISVAADDEVASPLAVEGEARGTWYFEASFPVKLVDRSGTVIATGIAQAEGEWMTEGYVPFKAVLSWSGQASGPGSLVFEKDNPSGLPENAGEIRIPVTIRAGQTGLSQGGRPAAEGGCVISGCSSQICGEEEMASTCEFRPEYSCYQKPYARCERQADGKCGWTPDSQLSSCLANPPAVQ